MKKTSALKTKTNIIETCMVYFKFEIQKMKIKLEKLFASLCLYWLKTFQYSPIILLKQLFIKDVNLKLCFSTPKSNYKGILKALIRFIIPKSERKFISKLLLEKAERSLLSAFNGGEMCTWSRVCVPFTDPLLWLGELSGAVWSLITSVSFILISHEFYRLVYLGACSSGLFLLQDSFKVVSRDARESCFIPAQFPRWPIN